jgi:NADH-quinone oxidoreductase subunit J
MEIYFQLSAGIAVVATVMTVTARNAVHALLCFIVSLLAIAITLYVQGAVFAAALEVIIYAGAIMVLFLFVVMLLNVKPNESKGARKRWAFAGPFALAALLMIELGFVLNRAASTPSEWFEISPQAVARSLFTTYAVVVELTSFLLLAGLIAAYHVAKKREGARRDHA